MALNVGEIEAILSAQNQFSPVLKEAAADTKRFEQNLGSTMADAETHINGATKEVTALQAGFREAEAVSKPTLTEIGKNFKSLGRDMKQLGGVLTGAITAPILAIAGISFAAAINSSKEFAAQWEAVKASFASVTAAFGEAFLPALQAVVSGMQTLLPLIQGALDLFNGLPEPVRAFVGVVALAAAAIGPLVVALGSVITAIGIITPALPAIGAAFTVLTGPIGIVAAAVVGLGVVWATWGDDILRIVSAAYTAVKTWLWDKLEPVLTPLIGLIQSVGAMFEAFGLLVDAVGQKAYGAAQSWLGDKLVGVFNFVVTAVQTVLGWIDKIPTPLLGLLGPVGLVIAAFRHWDEITRIAQAVYTGVKTWLLDKFTAVVDGIKRKVDAVTGFFRDMYDKVVGNSFVPEMIARIASEFDRLNDVMVAPVRSATGRVTTMFADMGNAVFRSIGDLLTDTKRGAGNLARELVSIGLDTIVPGLGRLVDMAWPLIQKGLAKIWDGLKAFARRVKNVFNFFGDAPRDSFDPEKPSGGGPDPHRPNVPEERYDPDTGEERPEFDDGQNVPNFADGGYVPARAGGTLVRVGEAGQGEFITPERQMGGVTVVMNISTLDVDSFRRVREQLTREVRQAIENNLAGERTKMRAALAVG